MQGRICMTLQINDYQGLIMRNQIALIWPNHFINYKIAFTDHYLHNHPLLSFHWMSARCLHSETIDPINPILPSLCLL